MDDSDPHIRYCGINLLSFYPFAVNNNEESFLPRILACQNDQEARLWARFLRYVNVLGEIKYDVLWKNFLESILSRGHKVYLVIQIAALDRYRTIIDSQDNKTSINEHDLGLPLIFDN